MRAFDPRVTPARADLAARHLEGKVEAARYVEGRASKWSSRRRRCAREPAPDAPLETEALKGERVTIYDANGEGWGWGQLAADGYVGWLPANALARARAAADPQSRGAADVCVSRSVDQAAAGRSAAARRRACRRAHAIGDFAVTRIRRSTCRPAISRRSTQRGGFRRRRRALYRRALSVGRQDQRSGLDCSGLVQVALTACGIACPRDSDMQEAALGTPVAAAADLAGLRRGDLVFWKGHVAIVRDSATLAARQRLPYGGRRGTGRRGRRPHLRPPAKRPACGGSDCGRRLLARPP